MDHEDFIGLYQVDSIIAKSLTHAINLRCLNVSLSNCCGKMLWWCINMSGSRSGVVARLCLEEKHAIYVHHALNLAVGTTIMQSEVCSNVKIF